MSNNLAAMRPELVREWSEKNLPLTPDKIVYCRIELSPVSQWYRCRIILFNIRFYHKSILVIFNQAVIPHFSQFF